MACTQGVRKRSSERLSCTAAAGSPSRRVASTRAGVERGVGERPDDARAGRRRPACRGARARACAARRAGRRGDVLDLARGVAADAIRPAPAVAAAHLVEDGGTPAQRRRGTSPRREGVLERLVAPVGVEVGGAAPAQGRPLQRDLDPRSRAPSATSGGGRRRRARSRGRVRPDGWRRTAPRTARGQRHRDLVEPDRQRVAVPGQRARADARSRRRSARRLARPRSVIAQRLARPAVERDVEGAVVERVAGAAPPRAARSRARTRCRRRR